MPQEPGHENSQIGSEDAEEAALGPRRSGSPINSPPVDPEQVRSRANTGNASTGLNLVGFNVPLAAPIQGVKDEAQAAWRRIDRGLGGTRLEIDTETYNPYSTSPREVPASTTAPGPSVPNNDDNEEDDNDIEMRERQESTTTKEGGNSGNSIEDDNPFFAVPGGPGIRARRIVGEEGDPNAFFHPASKDPQVVIWLPSDKLGLCKAEVEKNRELGIETSSRHAWLVGDGKVRVSGRPPE